MSLACRGPMAPQGDGPLAGLRVLEFASIGPGPHCAMLLADLGADVLRIDRPGGNGWPNATADRGRAVLVIDARTEAGRCRCIEFANRADVVLEGFRPGVMERLGLGPDELCESNPRLIYGRLTGWGQSGPAAFTAGHDINYIALTGALASIGEPDGRSLPPLNLVGDFGGGSMFMAFGILAALLERQKSGVGQIVDGAIVDGVASLLSFFSGATDPARATLERRLSLLGGAAPFYRTYRCADGLEMAIGPLERPFYSKLLAGLGAPPHFADIQYDRATWDLQTTALAALFATRTRAEWCARFDGTDACATPVLTLAEAAEHAHSQARGIYQRIDGAWQAAPAPRFSRTPGKVRGREPADALVSRWFARRPDAGE